MRRIITVLSVAVVMAMMLVVMAAPAFAGQKVQPDPVRQNPDLIGQSPGGIATAVEQQSENRAEGPNSVLVQKLSDPDQQRIRTPRPIDE